MPRSFSEKERAIIKQSMLDAGSSLMRTKNIRQITVEEIAVAANISKGSFYSFFNSREELFWSVIKAEEQQLFDEISEIASCEADTGDKIRKVFYDVFLRKSWIVYSISESDLQYIARKMPTEILEADTERVYMINKNLLSLYSLEDTQENLDFLNIIIQLLRITETNFAQQTQASRKMVQHVLVEAIVEKFCGSKED